MKDTVIQVEEGKVSSAWNHDANQSYLTLRQFLQPSLITMALCGCYTFGKKSVRIIGITYRIIYLLFCLAACAKTIAAFTTLSTPSSLVNLTITLWYTQCLTMFLISLKSTHTKYGGQRKAFEFWDEKIRPEIEALEIEFPENKLKKRQTIYLIVATVLNVMNFLGSLLLHTDVITEGIGTIFAAPFAKTIPALAFSVFLLTLIQAVWLFPMFYIMLISTILTTTFEEFNKFLNKHIEQNCSAMIYKFQKIRQLHLNLCKMVSQCDQDFGWYFATIFVFSIGSTCFVLYVLLKIPMDFVNVLVFVFWLVSSLTLLGALSVSAAFVNEAVSIITDMYVPKFL